MASPSLNMAGEQSHEQATAAAPESAKQPKELPKAMEQSSCRIAPATSSGAAGKEEVLAHEEKGKKSEADWSLSKRVLTILRIVVLLLTQFHRY